jgi:superfamily II DNA/RNA helicase
VKPDTAVPATAPPSVTVTVATAPVTAPSSVTVAAASPLKTVAPEIGAKALLANAKKSQNKLEKYVEITDSDLDAPAPPPKKKGKDGARSAKDERKEKEKREKEKQKEKKEKKKERANKEKSKAKSSDVDMDDADDAKQTKGKQRQAAPTKREKQLEAELIKLRKLLTQRSDGSDDPDSSDPDPDSSATEGDEGSEDEEEDARPTKKGKEPPKKAKALTVERPSRKDPKVFSYYKAQGGDIRALAQNLKDGCARLVFLNWWPEEAHRAAIGEQAYAEAVEAFRSVINISSSDEELTSKQKAKQRRKGKSFTDV